MLSRPNSGISFSSPGFLVQCSIASSSGTRRQAGAALGVELRRMMTRFLLFHQTQDTTHEPLLIPLGPNVPAVDYLFSSVGVERPYSSVAVGQYDARRLLPDDERRGRVQKEGAGFFHLRRTRRAAEQPPEAVTTRPVTAALRYVHPFKLCLGVV